MSETIRLLEDHKTEKFFDSGLSNDFFGYDTKSTGNKSKNKQVELHQTETLLQKKQQNEKITYRMGENSSKPSTWEQVNSQNIGLAKKFIQVFPHDKRNLCNSIAKETNKNSLIKKWAKDLNWHFPHRKHTDRQ